MNPIAVLAVGLVFSAMLFLPFWPGLRESLWPKDEYPLTIKLQYSKDPRHLGESFRRIIRRGMGDNSTNPGVRTIQLSKQEVVEIKQSCRLKSGDAPAHILMIQNQLHTESTVTFKHELYVVGSTTLGSKNKIRSLACDEDVILGEGTRVMRWIDAHGSINVDAECDLGVSCACANRLTLGTGVVFRRLFGSRISSPGYVQRCLPERMITRATMIPADKIKTIEDITNYRRKSSLLMSETVIDQDLIVKGDLDLADSVTIHGDIHSMGRTIIGRRSVIWGDVFAEGPIEILPDAVVIGNVFSQASVRLFPGARVGKAGCTKSVIAKKQVVLDRNVAIHGYVLTEGKGLVL
jgi:cytoskeletal protein CcmA (bactofilin family)